MFFRNYSQIISKGLPDDLWSVVFAALSADEHERCKRVSKRWRKIMNEGVHAYVREKTAKEARFKEAIATKRIVDKERHARRITNSTKSRRDGLNKFQLERLQRNGISKFLKPSLRRDA